MQLSLSLSLTGRLLSSFSPSALFALAEPGVWYDPSDLTTLFQDTAGTTPVTTPGQTVALALDKSKGLVLGSELVTVPNASLASSALQVVGTGLVAGRFYRISATVSNYTGSGDLGFASADFPILSGVSRRASNGEMFGYLVAASSGDFEIFTRATNSATFSNISVKELPGNHATQSTAASRPTYGIVPAGGRRNLLTYSEQFDNAAWGGANRSITANTTAAPNGEVSADTVTATAAASAPVSQDGSHNAAGTYTAFVSLKAGTSPFVVVYSSDTGANYSAAWINLSTGALGTVASVGTYSAATAAIVSQSNSFYRIALTFTKPLTGASRFAVQFANADNSFTATNASTFIMWGAQLELGSTATAYQRVVTAFDVTEAGVASLSYLSFDGVDDFLVTPTITPGVDKAQVFAGVRKLSDAARGVLVELGPPAATGTFRVEAPSAAAPTYAFTSTGTIAVGIGPNTFPAPDTAVLTAQGGISTDTAILRRNGAQVAQSSSDQGTGNYSAAVIYIGRRAGTSLPFNGNIFSLVVRFGANLDASTITNTERWVGGKTGVTI